MFYHIKNLQSTKTVPVAVEGDFCFITLRIYKVLKPSIIVHPLQIGFITLRIYKVLKPAVRLPK